jgi:hypothetical protein
LIAAARPRRACEIPTHFARRRDLISHHGAQEETSSLGFGFVAGRCWCFAKSRGSGIDRVPLGTDKLGYTRYWFAEHHNMASMMASAPKVLLASAAAKTEIIRFGARKMMIPNHSP